MASGCWAVLRAVVDVDRQAQAVTRASCSEKTHTMVLSSWTRWMQISCRGMSETTYDNIIISETSVSCYALALFVNVLAYFQDMEGLINVL